jgi:hypothetical protein
MRTYRDIRRSDQDNDFRRHTEFDFVYSRVIAPNVRLEKVVIGPRAYKVAL